MYAAADMSPAIRSRSASAQNPHPVFAAYMDMRYSRNMSRDEAREKVIPTYMGLIKQIDDQMGVLMQFLEERGLLDTTMIVFTSDHGDYLGDHWMGEKDLFHEQSAKIPLIVIDPSKRSRRDARHASATRWSRRSISRRPSSIISAASCRTISSKGARCCRCCAARRRRLAQGGVLRIRLRHAGRAAEAEPADRALPPVHGVRRPLEIHPRLRLPPDAVRPRNRSGGIPRSRRRSGMRRRHRAAAGRAVRLGAASQDHITTPREKIAAYADNQLQVKGGILIGIWDEAELASIREKIGMNP